MDQLTEWELQLLIDNVQYSSKNEWEIARQIMYTNVLPYMNKNSKKTAKDMFPLATDEDFKAGEQYNLPNDISSIQIQEMKKLSTNLSEKLSNGKRS
jgi:hypothetical protein